MTTTTNWRDIDTSTVEGQQALNRIIAEREGWMEIREDSWWEDDYEGSSEEHGLTGIAAPYSSRHIIPSYCTDLNAAIQLKHEGYKLTLESWYKTQGEEWLATYYNNPTGKGIGHWHDNPATAICLAWLSIGSEE